MVRAFLFLLVSFSVGAFAHADGADCSRLLSNRFNLSDVQDDLGHHDSVYHRVGKALPWQSLVERFELMLGTSEGRELNLSDFESASRVLFLSDGSDEKYRGRLGPVLAREYPEKTVISADYGILENTIERNLGKVFVDNTQTLPFLDNQFDAVVLRHGMCICESDYCCAGFVSESDAAQAFFAEVIRVLNKQNPNAFAILQGGDFVGNRQVVFWESKLKALQTQTSFQFEILRKDEHFYGFLIRPLVE